MGPLTELNHTLQVIDRLVARCDPMSLEEIDE